MASFNDIVDFWNFEITINGVKILMSIDHCAVETKGFS